MSFYPLSRSCQDPLVLSLLNAPNNNITDGFRDEQCLHLSTQVKRLQCDHRLPSQQRSVVNPYQQTTLTSQLTLSNCVQYFPTWYSSSRPLIYIFVMGKHFFPS
ncbi:hypothetical protein PoB_000695800 [Plakobranchus ocellatus]|uniref:Uncharacterized protein n=1 Tax=Plakobranchus ocellatus TaxID=259542 RepID=A0AAV3YEB1_9GAST|nr:hypothetical protein PoB_000695800 [Plakobranchus ocellatus]